MDLLSDILTTLRLQGTMYFRTRLSPPWGIDVPADGLVARFHVIVNGECWIGVPPDATLHRLLPGDLAVVPHGSRHLLLSAPEQPAHPLDKLMELGCYDGHSLVVEGGQAANLQTRMVCGYFSFDTDVLHPLLAGLPRLLVVHPSEQLSLSWLESAIGFIDLETRQKQQGASAIAERLSEILFIQAMRAVIDAGGESSRCLIGLTDRYVGRSLALIHKHPAHPWSVEELARACGLSRTAFALRFRELVGLSPGQYLCHWRMQLARRALLERRDAVALIAEEVGYQSEAAFNKVFKRHFQRTPASYRRCHAEPATRGDEDE